MAWLAALLTYQAHAETCPCDFSNVPDSAWTTESLGTKFDKVSIDTGVLCSHRVYKETSETLQKSIGHFTIFKRFVGITDGEKSQKLAEIEVAHRQAGTVCLSQVENTGVFDSSKNSKIRESLSKEEAKACLATAKAYAQRLDFACEEKTGF